MCCPIPPLFLFQALRFVVPLLWIWDSHSANFTATHFCADVLLSDVSFLTVCRLPIQGPNQQPCGCFQGQVLWARLGYQGRHCWHSRYLHRGCYRGWRGSAGSHLHWPDRWAVPSTHLFSQVSPVLPSSCLFTVFSVLTQVILHWSYNCQDNNIRQ